ncbi:MAG: prepilin-type N-terminal cleavage/methylation domain-containing protein [Acidobacteria bacterium]|uniref:Prepilin-type N-terminal cleavage/methylation domain-containing protein n=1 Tax=Candidatus Polarisedimenticola svalbardensis TaxID=2886004 RepID=A0A8J7C2P5_9BACT|nr:prepilin-type N-terminal cleavage/methylation domain-containing protein [Candidatus Polarisedimenticola svalbardensis]
MMITKRGFGITELLVVLALAGLGLAVVLPAAATMRAEGRCAAGARHMVGTFRKLRSQSVALRRYRGLYFHKESERWMFSTVEDGNGNGLRTAEVRDGTDPVLEGPFRLEDMIGSVRPGFPFDAVRELPPGSGWLGNLQDPVKFGRSNIVSFSPLGRSSSGTLYLTDGVDRLYAVVLYGPSTRIRVWRYRRADQRWVMR